MRHKLHRLILPVVCAGALAAAPPSAGAVTVGIADSGTAMFTSPLFGALHVHQARTVVTWDVAQNAGELAGVRAWIAAAQAAGVTPLVSFSGVTNNVPTVAQYTTAVKAFIHDFPQVKDYTAWNEPDWVYRPKLAKNPRLAAQYNNALVSVCHGCTVAAGDLYLPAPQLGRWLRSYVRYLKPKPRVWALHNYYDVRTFKTSQIQTLEKYTSGQIWLDEISGVERRGHWQYKNQSVAAAAKDEQFLFSLPKKFPRITRIYHYQWQDNPAAGWDSGLLDQNGKPRPAYYIVQKAAK